MDLFVPMLVIGLVTSVHCVAMCGPLVLTYAVKGTRDGSVLQQAVPHLAYQGAKLVSYVAVGVLLGWIGSLVDLSGARGWVTLAAGVAMVAVGLQMTGRAPALARLMPRMPKALVRALGRLRKTSGDGARASSLVTPVAFGLLTGFMPCGPLIAAQIAAAGTGSPISGAIAMLGFGLGTMPLMLGFGTVSGMLSAPLKKRMMAVSAVLVMVLGLVMFDRGLTLVGSPVTARSIVRSVLPDAGGKGSVALAEDGVAEVRITIDNTRFSPRDIEVPAGARVRLIVDRREDDPCSAQLAVPQAGVLADLAPFGTTAVELPPLPEGRYTLTCGMGMMDGEIRAVAGRLTSGARPSSASGRDTAVSPGGTAGYSCACCGGGSAAGPSITGTATVEAGVQRISVDASSGRYVPDVLVLKAGIPAEIAFSQASGCLAVVQIPDLGVSEDLTRGPVTVRLPALPPGEIGFSCGMSMVFGKIVVR
ncbi:MAG: sulfite exporter TauE/SafE family protein [Coriobacteriia bacterium]|nr:sulfite exporter TauE/SafE family protein [Coriobacteriia bacterium]